MAISWPLSGAHPRAKIEPKCLDLTEVGVGGLRSCGLRVEAHRAAQHGRDQPQRKTSHERMTPHSIWYLILMGSVQFELFVPFVKLTKKFTKVRFGASACASE